MNTPRFFVLHHPELPIPWQVVDSKADFFTNAHTNNFLATKELAEEICEHRNMLAWAQEVDMYAYHYVHG